MTLAFPRLVGVCCLALVLAACSSAPSAPVTSASFEPENVLTLGRGASDPSAVPTPVAAAPVAAETAPGLPAAAPSVSPVARAYAVATPTTVPDPAPTAPSTSRS